MSRSELSALLTPQPPWHGLPLSVLDGAMAFMLNDLQPSTDDRHLWLAALVHYQWSRGHACLELSALSQDAAKVLSWSAAEALALPTGLPEAARTLPWIQGTAAPLVLHGDRLYLQRAWVAEQCIRRVLTALTRVEQGSAMALTAASVEVWIDELFASLGHSETALAQQTDQRAACRACLQHPFTLVSGGPGTGKTTTVARMLALLQRQHAQHNPNAPALRVLLAAPTGKASARLAESMRKAVALLPEAWRHGLPEVAQTLQRLMFDQTLPWPVDVLVVDEASMVDLELMARVLVALPPTVRLIVLGDAEQLASVAPGAVLAQLCEADWLAGQRVALRHSHRFVADQGIGQWARLVQQPRDAEWKQAWAALPEGWPKGAQQVSVLRAAQPGEPSGRAVLLQAWSPWWQQVQTAMQAGDGGVSDVVARRLLDSLAAVGVLCALREGPWGVTEMNRQIASVLGLGQNLYSPGRPLMVTRNNPSLGLVNGDVGLCLPQRRADGLLRLGVAFPMATGVRWVASARLSEVEPVFAMTIHKSQGSEFDHVLLVLPPHPSPILTRELIYTGVTRAKQRLTWWAAVPKVLLEACHTQLLRSGGLGD